MIFKLTKYELRSTLRNIAGIWAALLVIALLMAIAVGPADAVTRRGEALANISGFIDGLLPMVYFAIFVAMIVLTVLIVIQRFSKGLLGDEGYLMHTLPVKPGQLIASKGAAAMLLVVISALVALLSISLVVVSFKDVFTLIADFLRVCVKKPDYLLLGIELLLVFAVYVLKAIYKIYASLSVGQLFDKHRSLAAFLAFVVISVIMTTVLVNLVDAGFSPITMLTDTLIDKRKSGDGVFLSIQLIFAFLFITEAAQLLLYHFISERILTKKLNLI